MVNTHFKRLHTSETTEAGSDVNMSWTSVEGRAMT